MAGLVRHLSAPLRQTPCIPAQNRAAAPPGRGELMEAAGSVPRNPGGARHFPGLGLFAELRAASWWPTFPPLTRPSPAALAASRHNPEVGVMSTAVLPGGAGQHG